MKNKTKSSKKLDFKRRVVSLKGIFMLFLVTYDSPFFNVISLEGSNMITLKQPSLAKSLGPYSMQLVSQL